MRAASATRSNTSTLFKLPSQVAPASTRLLTTKREKVKVLAVLYDGGEHAKQVCGIYDPLSPLPVRPRQGLVNSRIT